MSELHTTYDFNTKTFGHATMLVGLAGIDCPACPDNIDVAMIELEEARERLSIEHEKIRKGQPYDFSFVHGYKKY